MPTRCIRCLGPDAVHTGGEVLALQVGQPGPVADSRIVTWAADRPAYPRRTTESRS